jgi:hypothetical protein
MIIAFYYKSSKGRFYLLETIISHMRINLRGTAAIIP